MKKIFLVFTFLFLPLCFIGCSSVYNPATGKEEPIFTPSEGNEGQSGQKISKAVEEKFKSVDNYGLQTKIQKIGASLASHSDRKDVSYHFEVLDEKEVNAFAIPGGYIYIFKGLIDKTDSDDEIAGVLAHEIGHTAARHVAKRVHGSLGLNALAILITSVGSDPESKQQAYQGLMELMLEYSREDELEADRLAVKYMTLAGYNPQGIITFLEKLRKIEFEKPIQRPRVYKTHPYIADRIKTVKQQISGKIDFEDYINSQR